MPKHLTVLALLIAICSCSVDQSKVEGVYREAKRIQSATSEGVTFQEFDARLQSLLDEISILKDKNLNTKEERFLYYCDEATGCFRESKELWRLSTHVIGTTEIHVGIREGGEIFPFAYCRDAFRIIEKYGIPIENSRIIRDTAAVSAARVNVLKRILWAEASIDLDIAFEYYAGRGLSQEQEREIEEIRAKKFMK